MTCEKALFKEHALSSHILTRIQLRSEATEPEVDVTALQIQDGSVVAIACDDLNFPFYLIKVIEKHGEKETPSNDGYGHEVPAGFPFIEGRYLERKSEGRGVTRYTISKKPVYFHSESVMYPCVVFLEKGSTEIRIDDSELVLINDFINSV